MGSPHRITSGLHCVNVMKPKETIGQWKIYRHESGNYYYAVGNEGTVLEKFADVDNGQVTISMFRPTESVSVPLPVTLRLIALAEEEEEN